MNAVGMVILAQHGRNDAAVDPFILQAVVDVAAQQLLEG